MPERIKIIPTGENYSSGTSIKSLKGLLKSAGYSDKEIEKLRKDKRIALLPASLGTKLRYNQTLIVMEEIIPIDPKQAFRNRFSDLEVD